MPDTKISAMTDAGPLTGAELIPIVKGGVNYRTTANGIAALVPPPVIPPISLQYTYVGYGSSSNLLSGSADLIYDTVAGILNIEKLRDAAMGIGIRNFHSTGLSATAQLYLHNGLTPFSFIKTGQAASPNGLYKANQALLKNDSGPMLINNTVNGAGNDIVFAVGSYTLPASEVFRIYDNKGVGIRSSNSQFNLKIGSNEVLTHDNQLSIRLSDTDRALNMGGDITTTGLLSTNVPFSVVGGGSDGSSLIFRPKGPGGSDVYIPTTGVLLANPMIAIGELIAGGPAGVGTRLAPGTAGYVLTSAGVGSAISWQSLPAQAAASLTNTQVGVGNGSNQLSGSSSLTFNAGALSISGQVTSGTVGGPAAGYGFKHPTSGQGLLTIDASTMGVNPTWTLPGSQGGPILINPMNTLGDMIIGSTGGGPSRMAVGTPGQIIIANGPGVAPSWQPSPYMRYLGDWSAATNYVMNDTVSYGGNVYTAPGAISAGAAPPAGWTQVGKPTRQTLTDAATVTWNLALAPMALLIPTANRIIAAPTNMVQGASYALQLNQDGVGSRLITWNAVFKWPSGRIPVLSTAANSVDMFTFISDGVNMFGVMQPAFA